MTEDLVTEDGSTMVYSVAEHFVSIDGEGAHAGRLAAFIRFPGCNLRCSYCDTAWAQDAEAPAESMTLNDLVEWADEAPCACVTLTGGEPLLQPHLLALVSALVARDSIEVVEIETNGSVPLGEFALDRPAKLHFTMDYKLPSSGMEQRMCCSNFDLIEPDDVVKFVIGSREDLEAMLRVVRHHELDRRCQVYLSPVFGRIEPAAIVNFMKEHGLVHATLQLQLHKVIWPDVERGV